MDPDVVVAKQKNGPIREKHAASVASNAGNGGFSAPGKLRLAGSRFSIKNCQRPLRTDRDPTYVKNSFPGPEKLDASRLGFEEILKAAVRKEVLGDCPDAWGAEKRTNGKHALDQFGNGGPSAPPSRAKFRGAEGILEEEDRHSFPRSPRVQEPFWREAR